MKKYIYISLASSNSTLFDFLKIW